MSQTAFSYKVMREQRGMSQKQAGYLTGHRHYLAQLDRKLGSTANLEAVDEKGGNL